MRADEPSLRELFEALVDLPRDRHAAFFDARAVAAPDRERLERMLESRSRSDRVLPAASPADIAAAIGDDDAAPFGPGQRIGVFELIDIVGEGGSSTVFRAERTVDGVRQLVALKLLRRGVYTRDAQRQFRRERLALAQLQHPGIARFIEGGVTDAGLAYIALELVDGVPITDYASSHVLGLRARLALFADVCRAVEAAHRALIVHRDLKPTNVLVTREGEVKLLDFGIAKLLDADDDTETRVPAFTPAYAAPEQRSGAAITTATDVYALGVLLGELVTGRRVHGPGGSTTSLRTDESGATPALTPAARRALRGDLDTIVRKATAPDAERRYASAGALADDVVRLLDGRPVAAHPPSTWYRARKFVTRHRGGVTASVLFAVAILAALGVALWQANLAQREAARANAVRDFLVSVFKSAEASVPTDTRPGIDDVIRSATERLAKETALPDTVRADLLVTLAHVASSVGAWDKTLALVDEAEPILARVAGPDDARRWDATLTRADALSESNRNGEALAMLEPLRARIAARNDEAAVTGLALLGHALKDAGREDEAIAMLRDARERSKHGGIPLETQLSIAIAEVVVLDDSLHLREGLEHSADALAIWHRLGDPTDRNIIDIYRSIAQESEAVGDIARAEDAYQRSIALDDRFFDKPNEGTAWDVGVYGTFLVAQGRFGEAEPYVRRALDMRRQVLAPTDPRTLYAIAGMGKLRTGERNYAEAIRWLGEGIDTCRRESVRHQVCARLLALRAGAEASDGRHDAATRDITEAESLQRAFSGDASSGFAYILALRVVVENAQAHYADAIAAADRALAIGRATRGGMLQAELGIRYRRAFALSGLGRDDEAIAGLADVLPKYDAAFAHTPMRVDMHALDARLLARTGRADAARDEAVRTIELDSDIHALDAAASADIARIAGTAAETKVSAKR
jgi:serine/threonine-protein kinase